MPSATSVSAWRSKAEPGTGPASSSSASNWIGFNGRLAAWITNRAGTMTAFYAAFVFQIGWVIAGQVGGFDPYPYAFLLFLSSLTQLLLMFIIMVGSR